MNLSPVAPLTMKHIILLQARCSPGELHDCLLVRFRSPTVSASRVAVNLVQKTDTAVPWDAIVEIWSEQADIRSSWDDKEMDQHAARRVVYRVAEFVEKDTGPERGWPTSGPKLIVPWIGRAELTPAERRRHWDEHVPLATRIHVGCTRYVRNWIEAPAPNTDSTTPPYQGIAMLHFPTEQDLRERSFDTPASVQVIEDDTTEFIAEHVVLQTSEYFSTT